MGIRRELAVPTQDGYAFEPSEWLRHAERYLMALGYAKGESTRYEAATLERTSVWASSTKLPKSGFRRLATWDRVDLDGR